MNKKSERARRMYRKRDWDRGIDKKRAWDRAMYCIGKGTNIEE